MNDIEAMLRPVAENNEDRNARLIFADWIDEHYPATPVDADQLPKGFNAYWHTSGLSRIGDFSPWGRRGRWANWQIIHALDSDEFSGIDFDWFDHGGASLIAGMPVIVGEPYQDADKMLPAATTLQRLLKCPVTFSRESAHGSGTTRLTVWFMMAHLIKADGGPNTT